jgi:hypothetical protein
LADLRLNLSERLNKQRGLVGDCAGEVPKKKFGAMSSAYDGWFLKNPESKNPLIFRRL